MRKRMLFIGSLPTKKVHFNGETNKTGDIFRIFKRRTNYKITKINLTHFKLFNTAKMILCSMLFKYDTIFISKCIVGGALSAHLILKFGRKANKDKISIYWIGNGTNGLENKKIYLEDLEKCKCVIFESDQIYEEFKYLRIKDYLICECVKPDYDLSPLVKDYESKTQLKCIYFSRICEQKGLMDAIKAVEIANKKLGGIIFTLDIAGAPTSDEAIVFEREMLSYIKDKKEFIYYGKSFCVSGIETYQRLQQYDLHLFPSHFKQECVPGSIIDMFIAGVPTLSSSFPNSVNLLSNNDSYLFEQGNLNDFVNSLIYIYKNKQELNDKRIASNKLKDKYSEDTFFSDMLKHDIIS